MNKFFSNMIKDFIAYYNGFKTVLKIGCEKPITLEYPEEKRTLNNRFRGKLQIRKNEKNELVCIGCGMCVNNCPAKGVLNITKEKDENGKLKVKEFNIDISQCIFCGNCTEVCPTKAIYMTNEFELATENKSDMILSFKNIKEGQK